MSRSIHVDIFISKFLIIIYSFWRLFLNRSFFISDSCYALMLYNIPRDIRILPDKYLCDFDFAVDLFPLLQLYSFQNRSYLYMSPLWFGLAEFSSFEPFGNNKPTVRWFDVHEPFHGLGRFRSTISFLGCSTSSFLLEQLMGGLGLIFCYLFCFPKLVGLWLLRIRWNSFLTNWFSAISSLGANPLSQSWEILDGNSLSRNCSLRLAC